MKDKENKALTLLKQLEKSRVYDDTGNLKGWSLIESHDYFAAIESYLEFNKEIPAYEYSSLIRSAIGEVSKTTKPLDCKSVLGVITRKENDYIEGDEFEYILVTSISCMYSEIFKKMPNIPPGFKFSKSVPKKFDRDKFKSKWHQLEFGREYDYTIVQIKVTARGVHEGALKALDKLDLLRGYWNFCLNYQKVTLFSRPFSTPINMVTRGPFHTLHDKSGKAASELYWYDDNYTQNLHGAGKLTEIQPAVQKYRRLLSKHPYVGGSSEIRGERVD
ncbi:MAG TPA: hypothetical protein VIL74_07155 [Pyrinomonadaceae bacterium]